ncbi:MAG: glycoside hydrolase family 30 protein [Bacteroidota bacterium]|nr:glycoside hydrolase family 30 protein [Bacteroidota bacterium]
MKYPLLIVSSCLLFLACQESTSPNHSPGSTAFSTEGKKGIVYTTADSTAYRISPTDTLVFTDKPQPLENEVTVFVDPKQEYQSFFGVGGALTDASAETFYKLPKAAQTTLLKAYFDQKEGIGYTLARTNISSCDFSSDTYHYIKDQDSSLSSFTIEHDRKYKIPFIKEATAAAGGKLTLYASPWSPPAFMKTNNDVLHGGHLKPSYYASWAMYYTKFIKAYEKEGIPVWGITIQNEPMATQRWESCIYTAEEERDFLKNQLGPTLQKEGLGNVKIIGWDHNRDLLYQRASTLLQDPEAAKYLWGIGFHWYETWSGGQPMYDNVKLVHEAFPDKNLLFTEGCAEKFDQSKMHSWQLGEKYGANMIHDFNNGMTGFTDWNILLDDKGGPNHVGNFCFAPIHANLQSGELIFTNAYYYIGQFSKFIQPGAHRITSSASRSQLLTTAFRNPDGKLVVIVMNDSNQKTPYQIWIKGKAASLVSLPHSIATLVL